MHLVSEPEPPRGAAVAILPGIRRLVARNPSPMTAHGTNTYLIDRPEGAVVLDPGPDGHREHVEDVMRATDGKISLILLSHTHHDHHGLLAALRDASGAPTCGFTRSADPAITTDLHLADGETIAGLTAIHTPGHAADHLCFAAADGVCFTADHVMAWSTSVVSPPGGNMADYFSSLERMLTRQDRLYLPGHGPSLADPLPYVRIMLAHRRQREAAIIRALSTGPADTAALVRSMYGALNPALQAAAGRSVLAHLLKLQQEGRAHPDGEIWRSA